MSEQTGDVIIMTNDHDNHITAERYIMSQDLSSALFLTALAPRTRSSILALTSLMIFVSAQACIPVHKGNVRQGIGGVKREYTAIVRDSFSNADTDGSGYLEHREFPGFRQGPEISRLLEQISEYNKTGMLLFDEADENADGRLGIDEMLSTIHSLVP